MPVGGVVAEDRLEVDLLAEAVDAAIGEHRAAQQRVLLGGVVADAELPRLDALGPVRADVGDVAVLLGRHEERELRLVPALRAAQRQRRRDRDAVGVGRAASRRPVFVERDDRDLAPSTGSPLSRRVTKTSVFCGLSLTVRPRLVTWTTVARVARLVAVGPRSRDRSCLPRPPPTPGRCPPVRARARSRPCDWMRSACGVRRRFCGAASGVRRGSRSPAAPGASASARAARSAATHCVTSVKLRA